MLDEFPLKPHPTLCDIKLDKLNGPDTHWVAYYKKGGNIGYIDSYSNLKPLYGVVRYIGKNIKYNYIRYQRDATVLCGQLCCPYFSSKKHSYK